MADSLLGPVREIAEQAARNILEIYATDFAVAQKQDHSPLTQADLAAHRTICAGLAKLTPGVPILSEESANIAFATRATWQRYWLVDPLDGTKEFIKKNGEFTVNIALIDDHRPVLGVVHLPCTGTVYFAAQGEGSFRLEQGEASGVPLRTRQADPKKLVVSGSRSHGGAELQQFVERLPGEPELVSKGSSLKLCLVAEGRADIYPRFGLTSEWDTAAAQCVVEQAGGQVLDLDFQALRYNTKESLLNPFFLVIGDSSFGWRQFLPAQSSSV